MLSPPIKHDRAVILTGLALLTALSWAYLFFDLHRMQTSEACCQVALPTLHNWHLLDLSMLFVMWTVMMIGMMVPSAAPLVLLFAYVNRLRQQGNRPFVPTAIFLAGYLLASAAFSLLATFAQAALHAPSLLSPLTASTRLCGLLLIAWGAWVALHR